MNEGENPNRIPVRTLEDLATLDETEIIEGYHDGCANERCGDNRSRSYWHGWRNGQCDRYKVEPDEAQRELARVSLAFWKEHGEFPRSGRKPS